MVADRQARRADGARRSRPRLVQQQGAGAGRFRLPHGRRAVDPRLQVPEHRLAARQRRRGCAYPGGGQRGIRPLLQ
ncbi:hypothetical protein G6F31_021098 [Rhizopus arrhizus]|nr:hypothetical protein G6F31_021098 [Rhizopus arrhizus]